MPTFNNPRQVIVTEAGSGALAVLAAVLVLAAVVSAEAVLIEQVIQAVLVTAVTALAGSSAVLALVFRRTGVWVVWRPPVLTGRVVQVAAQRPAEPISAPRSRAIEAPKPRLAYPDHHATRPQPAGRTYRQARTPR